MYNVAYLLIAVSDSKFDQFLYSILHITPVLLGWNTLHGEDRNWILTNTISSIKLCRSKEGSPRSHYPGLIMI